MLLGVLYAKNRKRAPALAKFKRALELNPMLSDAWIAQAQVRMFFTFLGRSPLREMLFRWCPGCTYAAWI